jgi:tripartite-type tricarboxylate transporter receptor subunit TctC
MHPEVPSLAETGVAALDMESWFDLFAPAGVPNLVLARLRSEFAKVLADPQVAALFGKAGGGMLNLSPAQTEALIKRDVERWTTLIREAGISAGPPGLPRGGGSGAPTAQQASHQLRPAS